MSTNSIIGAVTVNGSVGVYCHWDGYPTGVGQELQTILKRDGYTKVAATLLDRAATGGFSELRADTDGVNAAGYDLIEGYGIAYNDMEDEPPITLVQALKYTWAEYAYFVRADGCIDAYALYSDRAKHWVIKPDDEIVDNWIPDSAVVIA